ncbi:MULTISPECIES: sigma-70 family RNA polymerase sigma factor [Hydrogenophaga]|uniref:sigma-70 family RNA polymerase sigma factor n=1 Tax=Hydrogenophaga TaxID=47420 RepID=UPI001F2ACC44|nr:MULTISPECIES: sigma-70 family RNA polymerase sigma factor [Hydrogenophaga]
MEQDQLLQHLPALRRYARALTGDAWAADDLVQDTLERACSRWRLWLAGSDLRAWLFTVMHNTYLNGRRSALARPVAVGVDPEDTDLPGPASRRDDLLDLQRCLLLLPDEQRCVLLLVGMEDMPYADVARVLGIPLGTVMSRLSRARARLRELMEAPARPAPTTAPAPLRRLK